MLRNKKKISWWKISFQNGESQNVSNAVKNKNISQGKLVEKFERKISKLLHVKYVVATNSGTSALLMSLLAIDLKRNENVIIQGKTWISAAHAVHMIGGKINLVDVLKNKPVIDISKIEEAINNKTKAIIVSHMGGRASNIKAIQKIAKKKNIYVIEDSAQALMSKFKSKYLGTSSDFNCFSLSVAKLISSGQGGFITTNKEKNYNLLKKIRTHGLDNIINSNWNVFGFNFRLTDIQASIALTQLKFIKSKIRKLKRIYNIYDSRLNNTKIRLIKNSNLEIPLYIEAICKTRDDLFEYLKINNIETRKFYPPINEANYLKFIKIKKLSNSKYFHSYGIYLPSGPDQQINDINYVIKILNEY